ncbi:MAG: hypothetical protein MJE68_19750, partial [Proteobacteria bacterium]|nr:hypothetical protein [Pseudomonadota bacterium]
MFHLTRPFIPLLIPSLVSLLELFLAWSVVWVVRVVVLIIIVIVIISLSLCSCTLLLFPLSPQLKPFSVFLLQL